MKCSHRMCNRGIGLVSHRRAFAKGLYCSRRCRDNYAAALPQLMPRLCAWLLMPVNAPAHGRLAPATVRAQRQQISF